MGFLQRWLQALGVRCWLICTVVSRRLAIDRTVCVLRACDVGAFTITGKYWPDRSGKTRAVCLCLTGARTADQHGFAWAAELCPVAAPLKRQGAQLAKTKAQKAIKTTTEPQS